MRITLKQLKALPVVSESGTNLGRVVDVAIDANYHNVSQYVVSAWPALLNKNKLLISPGQVVAIDAEKMIVKDAAVKEGAAERLFSPAAKEAPAMNAEMRD